MKIAWIYLDKRAATIDALKDYAVMQYIIDHHANLEEESRDKLFHVPAGTPSGMPRHLNPHAGKARLVTALDEISVFKERYRQALEYMAWFRPAWDALTDDERYMLNTFYLGDESAGVNSINAICEHFHIEKTSAYNKKNRALARLALLLYGK